MISYLKILKKLIPISSHKNFIVLLFLIFVSMIFEILTLNSVFILISYMTNPDAISFYTKNSFISEFIENKKSIIFPILFSLFFLIFLMKILITIFLNFFETKFIAKVKYELSNSFFKGYMSMPKIFHLRTNSAKIIRNITVEIDYLIGSLQSFSIILLEIVVLLGITLFLIFIDYKITLMTLLMFLAFMFFLSRVNSKKIVYLGKQRSKLIEERLKKITEGISGLNILELAGIKEKYIGSFEKTNKDFTEIGRDSNFRFSLPKPLLELFLLSLILFFIAFVLNFKINYNVFLPTLAVYLTAAYRLLPSFAKISHNLQKFNFFIQSADKLIVDKVKFDLSKQNTNNNDEIFNFKDNIIFQNVNFSYEVHGKGDLKEKKIFNDLNFEIKKGDKIGIFGSSGVGKSTFLDLIMGLLNPKTGKILVDNHNISKIKTKWHRKIGCVPQEVFILDTSIAKNISFSSENDEKSLEKIKTAISKANLETFINNSENGLLSLIGERGSRISGGEKQRIGIARALYNNPDVLIFDESTSSLDKQTENSIVQEIFENNKEKTIIFVSHNLKNLRYCEKVFELKDQNLSKKNYEQKI